MGFTVAIDGPAASGKGTVARAVAQRFGFGHLDTGLLYRATGRRMLDGEDPLEAARNLRAVDLERTDLRGGDVAQAASRVATDPQVRAALLDFQRAFARRSGGAVLDGRDIGTVICPDAETKLFITASQEVRATRRHAELSASGEAPTLDQVIADLRQRDTRDAARTSAPMIPAADAILIDTSAMEISDAVDAACAVVTRALEGRN